MTSLAAACVSAFVVNANTSAVSILLPSISKDVGASVAKLQWAVTGYSMVGAAGVALGALMVRHRPPKTDAVHRAAAAAAPLHTIPTQPTAQS